jgi:signal transduction histidine kinase
MGTGRQESGIVLEIEDNGCGIPPERLPQVFLPFFTTKEGGTGLGVPICVRLMENVRGRLGIVSAPGRTVVSLNWPPASG